MAENITRRAGQSGLAKSPHLRSLMLSTALTSVAVAMVGLASPALAASTWQDGTGDDTSYAEASNWTNGVPGAGDAAIFDAAGSSTVDLEEGSFSSPEWDVGTGTAGGRTFSNGTISLSDGLYGTSANHETVNVNIAGAGSVNQTWTATGTLELGGENTFTGGVTVTAGILKAASATSLGSSVTGGVTVNGGELNLAVSVAKSGLQLTSGSVTGAGTFTSSTAFDVQAGSVSAILDGEVGLTKTTVGTVTLTGANTYTGTTTISAGTLQVGAGGTDGTLGTGAVVDNAALVFDRSDDVTVANEISGTGTLEQAGSGTLTLTGANTYEGGTTISDGTIAVGSSGALGTGVVTNGGTLLATDDVTLANEMDVAASATGVFAAATGKTLTLTGALVTGNGATLTFGSSGNVGTVDLQSSDVSEVDDTTALHVAFGTLDTASAAGLFAHLASVTIDEGAQLKIGEGASYGGAISVAGTLSLTDSEALSSDAVITTTGSVIAYADGVDNAASININSSTTQLEVATAGWTATQSGVISSTTSDGFEKIGDGTLVLTGANTYAGTTVITAGTLQIGAGGTVGTLGTGAVTNNAALVFDRSDAITVANEISGTGTLEQAGAGTTTLTGTNSYAGTTSVTGGTLKVAGDGNLGTGALDITSAGGTATLEVSAATTIDNALTSGTTSGASPVNRLLSSATSGTTTFSGAVTLTDDLTAEVATGGTLELSNALSGAGTLAKDGDGTLNLTGHSNAYTGDIDVNAGTLRVNNDPDTDALGTSAITVTVASGATLGGAGQIGGDVVILDGGTLAPGNSPGTLVIAGDLTLNSTSNSDFELGGPNTIGGTGNDGNDLVQVTGQLTLDGTVNLTNADGGSGPIEAGYYTLYQFGTLVDNGATLSTPALTPNSELYATGGEVNVYVEDTTTQLTQYWDGGTTNLSADSTVSGGAGDWDNSLTNWTTSGGDFEDHWRGQRGIFSGTGGAISVDAGGVAFQDLEFVVDGYSLSDGPIALNGSFASGTAASTIDVDDSTGANITATINSVIEDGTSGALTKTGADTLVLAGNNTYTGLTTVSEGVLNIRHANALGTTAEGTTVSSGAALEIQGTITVGAEDLTLSGTGISSGGALRNISDTNTFGGAITLATISRINSDAGTLNLTGGIDGATFGLTLGGAGGGTVGTVGISGTGTTLNKDGAGKWTLTADNTFDGAINVDAGELEISGADGHTASTVVNINDTGTLTVESTATDEALNDTAVVTMAGTSQFNVNEDETIGRLVSASANATTTIAATKTLTTGDGTDSTYAGLFSGSGGLTKVGSDTFTLTGNSTGFTGATLISAGTLALSGAGSLPNSAVTVSSGATLDVAAATAPTVGSLDNGGTVNLANNAAGNVLAVNGAYTATNGTVNLDVNMDGSGVDSITADTFAGTTGFAFTQVGASQIWLADQTIVTTTGGQTGTYTSDLPTAGLYSYSLVETVNNVAIHQDVNLAALGGIAGNIATVQATIGAVVNRPSSPFVSGLAAPVDPNHCGPGPWGRATGGVVSASGDSTSSLSPTPDTSTVGVAYAGAQFGLDIACFNVKDSGMDVAVGVIAGANTGLSSQDLGISGVTSGSFQQGFGGLYATVAKGAFAADVQARVDSTSYTFNNSTIGLTNASMDTMRYTLSGSASYAIPVQDMNLVPSIGFSASQTTATALTFDTGETLTPDPSQSLVGFAGATIAKTIILPDEVSAVTPFATGTLYNDFAANPTAVFYDPVSTNSVTVTSQHLGMVGEVSLGLGYVKIMDSTGLKQINASVRLDGRFSDRVLGGGITAQVRGQY